VGHAEITAKHTNIRLAKILDIDENVAKIVKTSVYKVDVDAMK
jgi:hypothetical protein